MKLNHHIQCMKCAWKKVAFYCICRFLFRILSKSKYHMQPEAKAIHIFAHIAHLLAGFICTCQITKRYKAFVKTNKATLDNTTSCIQHIQCSSYLMLTHLTLRQRQAKFHSVLDITSSWWTKHETAITWQHCCYQWLPLF